MFITTDAIVLSLQPHSDKAHTLHLYTRASGRVNYKVYGIGRKNAIGMYNPLSLIQITGDDVSALQERGNKPPTLRSVQLCHVANNTFADPYKRTIALFISEILYHTLRHPMPDEPMFDFLSESVRELEETAEPQNFHLQFLVGLAAQLGFGIPSQSDLLNLPHTRAGRQKQLRDLCAYFAEHVDTFEYPRSLDVLTEIFD